jgi:hypothetical protein
MYAYKTIALPKRMPLTDRISEVSKQLSEWVRYTYIPPPGFRVLDESLRLIKVTKTDVEYRYHYAITLGARAWGSHQNENQEMLDSRAA